MGSWRALQVAIAEDGRRMACELRPEAWWASRASVGEAALQDSAVRACGGCPVRRLCAAYALRAGERHGVWGGLTPSQRRVLERRAQ